MSGPEVSLFPQKDSRTQTLQETMDGRRLGKTVDGWKGCVPAGKTKRVPACLAHGKELNHGQGIQGMANGIKL